MLKENNSKLQKWYYEKGWIIYVTMMIVGFGGVYCSFGAMAAREYERQEKLLKEVADVKKILKEYDATKTVQFNDSIKQNIH